MGAVSASNVTVFEQEQGLSQSKNSSFQSKEIIIDLPNETDSSDTFTIDLTNYGITNPKYIKGWVHGGLTIGTNTTARVDFAVQGGGDYGEIRLETPTTAGPGTSFVITVGGSASNRKRTYLVGGFQKMTARAATILQGSKKGTSKESSCSNW